MMTKTQLKTLFPFGRQTNAVGLINHHTQNMEFMINYGSETYPRYSIADQTRLHR